MSAEPLTVERLTTIASELGAKPPHTFVAGDGDTCLEWWIDPRKLTIWLGDDAEVLWCSRVDTIEHPFTVKGAPTNEENARKGLAWLVTGDESLLPEGT